MQDYREGVLESKDRRALRLWIRADLLFERDDKAAERLSDDGRTRLDSAMSQFVRYPRTSPARRRRLRPVADGGPAIPAQPIAAPSWSVTTSSAGSALDPNVIAVMPMGAEATDSPYGRDLGRRRPGACSSRQRATRD